MVKLDYVGNKLSYYSAYDKLVKGMEYLQKKKTLMTAI